jgi:hypothetical protein
MHPYTLDIMQSIKEVLIAVSVAMGIVVAMFFTLLIQAVAETDEAVAKSLTEIRYPYCNCDEKENHETDHEES